MTEFERVGAAISMTLCELATAKHHLPPLECFPFSSQPQENIVDEETQSLCVGALSRSAQFWSSYSGYLREAPQLCFAYRRWNDIDTAKSIYLNATLEKLALLRLLKHREARIEVLIDNWAESVTRSPAYLYSQFRKGGPQFRCKYGCHGYKC
ncbi:hypothetical protein K439DRAFT_704896 [Ramaria rubella]|nr:hypothetical protein K439DRAFT_704896 [Ramaria rubella]